MVILETAAIGAAGYGLYRGGDAAVRKGKETHKEYQRERVRQSQRSELATKSKTRQERIAQLVQLRQGQPAATVARASSSSTTTTSTTALSSSSSLPSDPWDNYNPNNNDTTTTNNNPTELNDRHRAVMEKLAQGRSQQAPVKKAGPAEKLKNWLGSQRK